MKGPFRFYRNNETENHAITVQLRDYVGNRFGIGSRVEIRYGEDAARMQVQELESGGGFLSYDATIAHFGLGNHDDVAWIEVVWSTGEHSRLEGPFPSEIHYRIERRWSPQ